MNYLIIGGSKSGKSDKAEHIAKELSPGKIIYVATMKPYDDEDKKRIENHRRKRLGFNFITIEQSRNINEILQYIKNDDTVLIDSITSLLTNEMFIGNDIIKNPSKNIIKGLKQIMSKAQNTIIVSDYIFNDSILYDEISENFKKELGIINCESAVLCENVIECTFGSYKYHKRL